VASGALEAASKSRTKPWISVRLKPMAWSLLIQATRSIASGW
jgi:hypothetical protein